MNAGSYKDLRLASPRPNDMRMNVSAFESAFNVEMPDLQDQIRDAAEEYGSKS